METKKNLKSLQICIFPHKSIDHYGAATPFMICEENIIDWPINRSYFIHKKKGLGITANSIENNHKIDKRLSEVKICGLQAKKFDNVVMFKVHKTQELN